MENDKEVWQKLSQAASRMKVDGGWIVDYEEGKDAKKETGTFCVPDPGHTWKGGENLCELAADG